MTFRSLVRSVETRAVPVEVARLLGLAEGAEAVHLRRERMLADEVVVAGTSWLRPTDWLPPADELTDRLFDGGSLASLLEHLNDDRPLQRLSYRVALDHPPADVAALFGPARDELAWWVRSVNGIDGVPLEVSLGWLRADVFRVLPG
ncbi:MAG: UTRA domain-containing protein [Acidimicrobiales bacterium]